MYYHNPGCAAQSMGMRRGKPKRATPPDRHKVLKETIRPVQRMTKPCAIDHAYGQWTRILLIRAEFALSGATKKRLRTVPTITFSESLTV
jgi:hypothetical protein